MTATRLPRPIEHKLASVRGHMRRIDGGLGLSRLGMAVSVFVAATFLLDRMLDFPVPFRAVLLVLGVGAIAFIAWRSLLRPLAIPRTDDEMALLVERAHPELNDELISAVQLARAPSGGGAFHSRELVEQVIAEAALRVERVEVARVASTAELRRAAMLTLALLLILGTLFVQRQRDARIWFERMVLLRDTPWPRTVELEVRIEPDPPIIAKGDDVAIVARVLRGQPGRVALHPTFALSGRGEPIGMVEARGEFRAVLDNVNEGFRFVVEGGDYRSRAFEVEVRARPKLEEIRVWLAHPGYTGIADTKAQEPLRDGNLKVPGGTVVRYEARASDRLKLGEVSFGTPSVIADAKGGLRPGGDGRTVAGEFRVKDSTAWTVRLVSEEGFESPAAATYQIRAVPDRLPDVRVVRPGRNKDVARAATVPLRVEVRDDYQPRAAALAFTIEKKGEARGPRAPGAAEAAPEPRRVPLVGLPVADGAKQVALDHAFDLAKVGLEVGDRVTYWVEAVDNRAPEADVASVPPESRGRSDRYQLLVLADEELERLQQAALKRLRDDLLALSKAQNAAKGDVESLAQELAQRGGKPDARDKKRLSYAELDQRKIGQRLEQARRTLGDVREEMLANKVAEAKDVRLVGELETATERIIQEPVARAASAIAAARQEERPDPAKLTGAARDQAEVVEGIEDIVRRLDKWDEVNEVIRDFRDLLKAQEGIKSDTQERAKKELGK